jgi:PmbA protein
VSDILEALLGAVRSAGDAGDGLWRREERTSISFEAGRLKAAGTTEEAGTNLRLVRGGRVGVAGTTAADTRPDDLVARARASAELGEAVALAFPAAQDYPEVEIYFDRAARASLDDLTSVGRGLVECLSRPGCQVNVAVEREVAETRVASSAGSAGGYRATGVAVSAELVRFAGDDVLMVYDQIVGADWPSAAELDALVASITGRLDLALRVVAPPDGALPVIFTPLGLAPILMPIEMSLSGKAVVQGTSKLADAVGTALFDPRLSLTDDPLVSGRVASRPCDDEGVPSRRLPLIERGVLRGFLYDLETAARAGKRSTGHGRRGIFGKPHIGSSNLVLGEYGERTTTRDPLGGGLLDGISDGLVIDDLIGVGQGNVIGGAFSHPVALAYRVEKGEITGRVKDAAVAGNVYDLLKRIGGWGDDARWVGSRYAPSLLLEGVSVARR